MITFYVIKDETQACGYRIYDPHGVRVCKNRPIADSLGHDVYKDTETGRPIYVQIAYRLEERLSEEEIRHQVLVEKTELFQYSVFRESLPDENLKLLNTLYGDGQYKEDR